MQPLFIELCQTWPPCWIRITIYANKPGTFKICYSKEFSGILQPTGYNGNYFTGDARPFLIWFLLTCPSLGSSATSLLLMLCASGILTCPMKHGAPSYHGLTTLFHVFRKGSLCTHTFIIYLIYHPVSVSWSLAWTSEAPYPWPTAFIYWSLYNSNCNIAIDYLYLCSLPDLVLLPIHWYFLNAPQCPSSMDTKF